MASQANANKSGTGKGGNGMGNDLKFGGEMNEFGRIVLQELIKTDYGPNATFDGIDGHNAQDHHGGTHDQITLFKHGVKKSDVNFRFFDD